MATIKEVAKLSGLGTSTVSRYFNKTGFVSSKSEDKILQACKELNYVPNALARAFKTKKTYTTCLILPTISNLFFPELAIAIEQTCIKRGYKVILCNTNEDSELEKLYLEMIQQSYVDGVIVATGERMYKKLNTDIPIVFLDRVDFNTKNFSIVTSDHLDGAVQASEYLIKTGCKKVLFIQPNKKYGPAIQRKIGFEKVMNEHQLEYKCIILEDKDTIDLKKLLAEGYDGALAWNDYAAAKFLEICHSSKIRIPEDMQIVGYDDIPIAQYLFPKLTTVSQPLDLLGKYAADILIDKIEGKITDEIKIVLENKLVIRQSTKEVIE